MEKGFLKGLLVGFCLTFLTVSLFLFLISRESFVLFQNDNGGAAAKAKIDLIIEYIDTYYDGEYNIDDLYDDAYKGILDSLGDKYSSYYTAEEYAKLTEQTSGKYVGIGAQVTYSADGNYAMVVAPVAGSPAEEAGLLAGDIIIEVDGESMYQANLDTVVSKIKGEEGTKVSVKVQRDGNEDLIEFTITRRALEEQTVKYEMLEEQIGYVSVSGFDRVTYNQFCEAVDGLTSQGMKGLIIDLRNNGGGLLYTATAMLDRLLPEKMLLVYTMDKNDKRDEIVSSDEDKVDVPIILLMNGGSASASEVFAGCLKDYGLAEIVGELSYGKGIVQTMYSLNDGSYIKLTTSSYYSPNGINIHGTGFTPDVEVFDDPETEEDEQLTTAINEMLKKIQ